MDLYNLFMEEKYIINTKSPEKIYEDQMRILYFRKTSEVERKKKSKRVDQKKQVAETEKQVAETEKRRWR